ncbi:MAG: uroporphyrinogen decarboxylase family protein [Kiritimatiellia bacterium]
MTPRERLFAALRGQPADHIPVWLLFPYHSTGYYVDVRKHPGYRRIADLAERHAITLNRRNLRLKWGTGDVVEKWQALDNADEKIVRHTVTCRGTTLWSERGTRKGELVNKKLLDSPEDFEAICDMPVETDEKVIYAALDAQAAQYEKEKSEFPAHLGSMMLDLGEPIHLIYHSANLEELSIASFYEESRARIAAFLGRLQEQKKIVYQYTLERKMADVYFLVGSELAAPPMVGLETFRRWIVPFAKDLIDQIHDANSFAIQHFHGFIKKLLPDFVEMGADAVHTIEAPPVGDCTLSEAFDAVGSNMTLIGNIQYDDFRRFTPMQMKQAVTDLLDEAGDRRFILSPTAGPFDENVSEQFLENYVVLMETAWNYAR